MSDSGERTDWNEARGRLMAAQRMIASPDPTQWAPAIARIDGAISLLDRVLAAATDDAGAAGPRRMLAAAWSMRVQALERLNQPRALDEAIIAQGRAIEFWHSVPEATRQLTDRGELAVALQHHGNLLQKRGGDGDDAAAIARYDEAIAVLRALTLPDASGLHQVLGVTWLNRGTTWVRRQEAAAPAEALRSFDEAISALEKVPQRNRSNGNVMALAAAWMNRAHAVLRQQPGNEGHLHARTAAEHVLELVTAREKEDVSAADLALKARHIICRAIGQRLAQKTSARSAAAAQAELFAAATDAVDDGLSLARHWHQRRANLPLPFVIDLFRFGAQTYLSRQPHFLAEFVLENLDPGTSSDPLPPHPELYQIARQAVALALQELERPQLLHVDAPDAERRIQSLHDLRAAAEKLATLAPESRSGAKA